MFIERNLPPSLFEENNLKLIYFFKYKILKLNDNVNKLKTKNR